jgi:hypothetical protein
VRLGAGARRHLLQEARELEADLREDLAVAARDGGARALERVERGVQLRGHAAESRARVVEAVAQQRAPERAQRVVELGIDVQARPQRLDEVLAADRAPGLSRRPRRVRAPVRAAAGARGHRRR